MELLTDANRANKANTATSKVTQKTYTDGTLVILNTHSTYQYFHWFYLWICCLRLLSASLSCWDGRALQQMVMMGLAKMKQTIQMEMIYRTSGYVASCGQVLPMSGIV